MCIRDRFDIYRGAVILVRVMEGRIAPRMKIRLCANNEVHERCV